VRGDTAIASANCFSVNSFSGGGSCDIGFLDSAASIGSLNLDTSRMC